MIDQVRAVLETYRTRVAFQTYTVALAPILLFSYFIFTVQSGHAVFAYLAFVAAAVAIFFALLGDQMKMQFTSCRAKLTPAYALPHFIGAFVVSSTLLLLLLLLSMLFYPPLVPPHLSIAALTALWTICVLAFSAGYFFRPGAVYGLFIVVMLNGTLVRWVEEMDRWTAVVVLVSDLVLTAAMFRRMLSATEEEWEYRGRDKEEFQRYMWTRFSKRKWMNRITGNREHVLDRPRPRSGGVISQIRYFAASMRMYQSLLIMTVMLAIAFWVGRLATGAGKLGMDPMTLVPFPAIMLFMQLEPVGRNLQSTFLLPLRREQLVFRYGAAMLLVLLQEWVAFAVAIFIVDWMPFPGKIGAFPALTPFLISLAVQVPMFGILTLMIGRSRAAIIVLVFMSTVSVLLSDVGLQWVPAGSVIGGSALIWFSYRHWCRADIV